MRPPRGTQWVLALFVAAHAAASPGPDEGSFKLAVAIDSSESMRGFAAAMPTLVDAFETALARSMSTRLAPGQIGRFWAAETLRPVGRAESIEAPASYGSAGADLEAALSNKYLTNASLVALITDGQTSPPLSVRQPCSELTRPDLSSIAKGVLTLLERGRRVWIILDRLPFSGKIYLNCTDLLETQREHERFSIRCESGRECWTALEKDPDGRVVMLLLAADSGAAVQATATVTRLLNLRPGSMAIQLHSSENRANPMVRTSHDSWGANVEVKGPSVGADAAAVEITCLESDLAPGRLDRPRVARFVVEAGPVKQKSGPLTLEPRATLSLDQSPSAEASESWLQKLPSGIGLDQPLLEEAAPYLGGQCGNALSRLVTTSEVYREDAARTGKDAGDQPAVLPLPGCSGAHSEEGDRCWEFIGFCDCANAQLACNRADPDSAGDESAPNPGNDCIVSLRLVATESEVVDEVVKRFVKAGLAATSGVWPDQLDRVVGLDRLLLKVRAMQRAKVEASSSDVASWNLSLNYPGADRLARGNKGDCALARGIRHVASWILF